MRINRYGVFAAFGVWMVLSLVYIGLNPAIRQSPQTWKLQPTFSADERSEDYTVRDGSLYENVNKEAESGVSEDSETLISLKTSSPSHEVTFSPTMKETSSPTPNPTSQKETYSPTGSPTNEYAKIGQECLKNKLKHTRTILDWSKCSEPFPDEDHTVYQDLPSEVNLTNITYLQGESWGQLCNKIGLIGGALQRVTEGKLRGSVFALPAAFSETAWSFDWSLLSNATENGVLMDCIECDKDSRVIRCDTLLYKGKLFDVSQIPLPVSTILQVVEVFYKLRPKYKGNIPALVEFIQPKLGLRRIVQRAVERFRKEAREIGAKTTVGIHRRSMDKMCYIWFSRPVQYNCYGRQIMNQAKTYENLINKELAEVYKNTSNFQNADEALLERVERAVPVVMTCNYTMAPHQVEILNKTWPILFRNGPVAFLIADDGQMPKGRVRFQQSSVVHYWSSLELMEDPGCFVKKKYHYMLAEMYAMAMTDLHMGMILSSCDDIVAIWRRRHGYNATSSFPLGCYSGYYNDIREPVDEP